MTPNRKGGKKPPLVLATLIATEVVSFIIAGILTLASLNRQGEGTIASRFVEDPSPLVEFAISFGIVNVALSGFALAFLAAKGFGRQ